MAVHTSIVYPNRFPEKIVGGTMTQEVALEKLKNQPTKCNKCFFSFFRSYRNPMGLWCWLTEHDVSDGIPVCKPENFQKFILEGI